MMRKREEIVTYAQEVKAIWEATNSQKAHTVMITLLWVLGLELRASLPTVDLKACSATTRLTSNFGDDDD